MVRETRISPAPASAATRARTEGLIDRISAEAPAQRGGDGPDHRSTRGLPAAWPGGRRVSPRQDRRQAIRFTANARFKVLPSGRLRLPKIGDVAVRWSRPLPGEPSSVTVIRDAAGRYFASFVVQTDPAADARRFPEAGREVGIDLGLAAFAVLSDGTKVSAPRFLRRAEKKLKRLQRAHSRKQKGSRNREKSRVALARAHATVADRRADFCHQVSTMLIGENQAVYVEDGRAAEPCATSDSSARRRRRGGGWAG